MTFARRVDANHRLITEALRKAGWYVIDTSRLRNFVDLVAVKHGRAVFVEVKTDRGKLTESQCKLSMGGLPIRIVRSVDDAVNL